ncbi:MAG: transposase [Deltaproteobacteria bacterium]|nr:transposase [Deltaproteobacteria bacterium]
MERERKAIGRPSKTEQFRSFVAEIVGNDPDVTSLEVLRQARRKGYTGGKSAMYELVASLRSTLARSPIRFEGLPGEFTQHDFGRVDVRFLDGTRQRRHFFVSRLKYSRVVAVTLMPDDRVETLVGTLVTHFESLGGVPLLAVFDRPDTIAMEWKRDGEVTTWTSTFIAALVELAVGVEVCRPAGGKRKGSVDSLVNWVKGAFFRQRRFQDDGDLHIQLAQWHEEVNKRRPCRATGVIPAERHREELPRLRPLKIKPAELVLKIPIFVGPTATVLHDTHSYSMPAEAIGIAGVLHLHRNRVRIMAGGYAAEHERLVVEGAKSTLPAHRTELVKAVSGKRAKHYSKREQLLELGDPVHHYLTEIFRRRPRAWVAEIDRLYDLLQEHGAVLLLRAFAHALERATYSTEHLVRFLKRAGS